MLRNESILVRQVKFILCGFLLISAELFADDLLYKDYRLEPQYAMELGETSSTAVGPVLEQLSDQWHDITIRYDLDYDNGKIMLVDYIIKPGKSRDFANEEIKKGKTKINVDWTSLVKIDADGKLTELQRDDRKGLQYFYSRGHGAGDYLYCIENKPLYIAPFFEHQPYLFHITGMGEYTTIGTGLDYIKLSIYDIKSARKILNIGLMLTNYHAFGPDEDVYSYHWFSAAITKSSRLQGRMVFPKGLEGRKRYAKLFIQDLDQNNKLDVVIWHREYASAQRDDPMRKGFYLDKQWFEWLEENAGSDGFNKRQLGVKDGQALLKKNKLWWKDGYPNQNLCVDGYKTAPYMMYIKDDEIGEPMGKTFGRGY